MIVAKNFIQGWFFVFSVLFDIKDWFLYGWVWYVGICTLKLFQDVFLFLRWCQWKIFRVCCVIRLGLGRGSVSLFGGNVLLLDGFLRLSDVTFRKC